MGKNKILIKLLIKLQHKITDYIYFTPLLLYYQGDLVFFIFFSPGFSPISYRGEDLSANL